MTNGLDNITKLFVDNYATHSGDREEALDPTTFLSFAELILELIKKIQECRGNPSPADVKKMASRPKLGQKIALRRHLIQAMGRKEFNKRGDAVEEALIQSALEAEEHDIVEVWNEAAL